MKINKVLLVCASMVLPLDVFGASFTCSLDSAPGKFCGPISTTSGTPTASNAQLCLNGIGVTVMGASTCCESFRPVTNCQKYKPDRMGNLVKDGLPFAKGKPPARKK